ncbi:hypothetical protein Acsp05_41230 [Actinokineospora sp. NBRC 105648]|nr:hypothetical protein Acsp05_41230 [Actinokineospora sp. NBRC 105648]
MVKNAFVLCGSLRQAGSAQVTALSPLLALNSGLSASVYTGWGPAGVGVVVAVVVLARVVVLVVDVVRVD